jgi:hypothetical protein
VLQSHLSGGCRINRGEAVSARERTKTMRRKKNNTSKVILFVRGGATAVRKHDRNINSEYSIKKIRKNNIVLTSSAGAEKRGCRQITDEEN